MKRLISLLVVIAVAGVWFPAMAQQVYDESVYLLESRDVEDPSPELVELCYDEDMVGEALARVPGGLLEISPLNVEWWTTQHRSSDGMVMREFVHKTGTADSCAYLVMTDSGLRMAIYADSDTSGIRFVGWGECDFPIVGMPTPASMAGNCSVVIEPDLSQGIAGGLATSNSVFGDGWFFWTVRIFWQ